MNPDKPILRNSCPAVMGQMSRLENSGQNRETLGYLARAQGATQFFPALLSVFAASYRAASLFWFSSIQRTA